MPRVAESKNQIQNHCNNDDFRFVKYERTKFQKICLQPDFRNFRFHKRGPTGQFHKIQIQKLKCKTKIVEIGLHKNFLRFCSFEFYETKIVVVIIVLDLVFGINFRFYETQNSQFWEKMVLVFGFAFYEIGTSTKSAENTSKTRNPSTISATLKKCPHFIWLHSSFTKTAEILNHQTSKGPKTIKLCTKFQDNCTFMVDFTQILLGFKRTV